MNESSEDHIFLLLFLQARRHAYTYMEFFHIFLFRTMVQNLFLACHTFWQQLWIRHLTLLWEMQIQMLNMSIKCSLCQECKYFRFNISMVLLIRYGITSEASLNALIGYFYDFYGMVYAL